LPLLFTGLVLKVYIVSQTENNYAKKTSAINSTLSEETVSQAIAAVKKSMTADKLFLNPDLSLNLVSEQIGIPQKDNFLCSQPAPAQKF
jgi:hypothetical protein